MAASYHARSNSFPSRSTPIASQFDEQLNRIKSSEFASSSTISSKLTQLSNLYESIDELLQLPSSQKSIFRNEKSIQDALENSIKFLDVCSVISDVLVQMKECAQELQSILRRRCLKNDVSKEVAQYLKSRKNAIKSFMKALKDLKKINNNKETTECNNVISKLSECQMVTLNVLESVLVSIAGNKTRSNWESVVSKMLKAKRVSNQQETEFFLVDFEVSDEQVMKNLENMEISIKNVEDGAEILFRHLIKTRTTILNILNC